MLDTHFDPKSAEERLYAAWEAAGAFKPNPDPKAEPFCVMIPPPNVTGSLHMGHALNNTLQDILCRFERMRGKAVLWQVGTDHAGIATQMVVERQLAEKGNASRKDMGREEFLKKVWEWKAESGGTIVRQLRRLGASCDWERERFTMDEGLSAAVIKVFVQLHKEGLAYRDKRLVNWDPHFETAISDLEVENRDVDGQMWRIAYKFADGTTFKFPIVFDDEGKPTEWEERDFIEVATTRPETLLGDTAVAVHPDHPVYAALIGKELKLPLTDRTIPIIGDDYADPTKGTGAVKITPAHDFNDFKVGKRHNLALRNIFDNRARLLSDDTIPAAYRGLDRFEARKRMVTDLESQELFRGVDKVKNAVPYGDRSGVVIEPYLTDQWYVNAGELSKAAVKAIQEGDSVFIPKNWEKTFFEWMRNIEPWCVSRQLWWGHRIPAWFGPDGAIFVEETVEAAYDAAHAYYKALGDQRIANTDYTGRELSAMMRVGNETLRQDEDVLDTWFSSQLWPFSTLGWPAETPEFKRFYPTNVLVTGFDIIFFWVARMMMAGLHFTKEVPFKDIYIHALVRDEKGAKMSKSKGNVIDPLEIVDALGADSLRFTLAAMAAQGRDIKLSKARVEGYRNFGTKLWNAARFSQMNECSLLSPFDTKALNSPVNKWIVGEVYRTRDAVTRELEAYRFNEAANAIYKFIWNVFCDWYLELIKPMLNGADEDLKVETRRTAAWALDQALILLHPFMPFITEELWARLAEYGAPRDGLLISHAWPESRPDLQDAAADAEVEWVINLITETRSVRSELNIPPSAKTPMLLIGATLETAQRLERYQDLIDRLARLEYSTTADSVPEGSVSFVLGEATAAIQVAGLVDVSAESARLKKEVAKLDGEISKIDAKLGNAQFVAKAPEDVIEEQKERRDEARAAKAKLDAALARLATLKA